MAEFFFQPIFDHVGSETSYRKLTGDYVKVEFHDGNRVVGGATKAPWQIKNIALKPGLHVLFGVG